MVQKNITCDYTYINMYLYISVIHVYMCLYLSILKEKNIANKAKCEQ